MIFQLPQTADVAVLSSDIYVDELKRVSQARLEHWMFQGSEDIRKLHILDAFCDSKLTTAMLLKWIANYGLALADSFESEFRETTDEIDRRISTIREAASDEVFARQEEWHQLPTPIGLEFYSLWFKFETVGNKTTMTVRDADTEKKHTITVHDY